MRAACLTFGWEKCLVYFDKLLVNHIFQVASRPQTEDRVKSAHKAMLAIVQTEIYTLYVAM